ncbi:hypothetical protein PV05_03420 [Exophiala xenobiotica]|uniref:Uncharacterized protein n=1 Tax=Exophiala xenobiotica TaxID=348802 RepID=A0A0D2ET74_9EURO|nr:uncharacterized protein PV05_03420 [Exophiala xenobiotica]KIW58928.1 hypothetical protein PV05_03420 [Exophiala xenobiotica]
MDYQDGNGTGCGCSLCEVFAITVDDMSKSPNRVRLRAAKEELHRAYTGQNVITDERENGLFEALVGLAKEDGLHDLRKMLQHLWES